jgi:hypothetical protein
LLDAVTAWMAHQDDLPRLSGAIGRLVELGLASETHQDRQKRRARKMAGDTIDGIADMAATADRRASRKRDLIDGPKEFDRVRLDRPRKNSQN